MADMTLADAKYISPLITVARDLSAKAVMSSDAAMASGYGYDQAIFDASHARDAWQAPLDLTWAFGLDPVNNNYAKFISDTISEAQQGIASMTQRKQQLEAAKPLQ